MSILDFLRGQKKTSASIAKNRLQLILINGRSGNRNGPDFLPQLRKELIDVISKYVNVSPDDIQVNLDRQETLEVLEVKIEMPSATEVHAT